MYTVFQIFQGALLHLSSRQSDYPVLRGNANSTGLLVSGDCYCVMKGVVIMP